MTKNKQVFIIGAGGHGRVAYEIIKLNGYQVLGFINDNIELKGQKIDSIPVLGDFAWLLDNINDEKVFIAIGDNERRAEYFYRLLEHGLELINAVHPTAILSPTAEIQGRNILLAMGSIIGTKAVIKDNVIINTGAILDHEVLIEKHVHISPGVKIAGRCNVGEFTHVGIGATLIQDIDVGRNCIIGAGAVVLKNVPDGWLAAGVPAALKKELKA